MDRDGTASTTSSVLEQSNPIAAAPHPSSLVA